MSQRKKHGNQRGSILLYTLIVLTILCLVGAIGIQTTWFELRLSGNDRLINRLKIKAESAALAAMILVDRQHPRLLRDSDWESPTRMPWLSRGEGNRFDQDSGEEKRTAVNAYIRDTANWDHHGATPNCAVLAAENDDDEKRSFFDRNFPDCRFQVIDMDVAQGSSLQTGNRYETLHNLYITGFSTERQGKCLVQIGYRKRY